MILWHWYILNQTLKYLSNIMYILYKINTLSRRRDGWFPSNFQDVKNDVAILTSDSDTHSGICWILYHEHFRFDLDSPKSFRTVVGCYRNDDILIALNNYVKITFYTDCQWFKTILRTKWTWNTKSTNYWDKNKIFSNHGNVLDKCSITTELIFGACLANFNAS